MEDIPFQLTLPTLILIARVSLFLLAGFLQVFAGWRLFSVCRQLDVGVELGLRELPAVPTLFLTCSVWHAHGSHRRIREVSYFQEQMSAQEIKAMETPCKDSFSAVGYFQILSMTYFILFRYDAVTK